MTKKAPPIISKAYMNTAYGDMDESERRQFYNEQPTNYLKDRMDYEQSKRLGCLPVIIALAVVGAIVPILLG